MSPKLVEEDLKAEAHRLRYEERLSTRKISERLGISKSTLSYWFSPASREKQRAANRAFKAKQREERGPVMRTCPSCGESFERKTPGQKYCDSCREKRARPKPRKPRKRRVPKGKPPKLKPKPPGRKPQPNPKGISPILAADIDKRVAARMAAMEDE